MSEREVKLGTVHPGTEGIQFVRATHVWSVDRGESPGHDGPLPQKLLEQNSDLRKVVNHMKAKIQTNQAPLHHPKPKEEDQGMQRNPHRPRSQRKPNR